MTGRLPTPTTAAHGRLQRVRTMREKARPWLRSLVAVGLISAACGGEPETTTVSDGIAQSGALGGLAAAEEIYADSETYEAVTPGGMNDTQTAEDTGITFVAGASTGPRTVSIEAVSPTEFRSAALGDSGTCWGARDLANEAGKGFARERLETCRADGFPPSAYSLGGWAP